MAQEPLPVPAAPLSNLSFPTPDDLDDIQGDLILGIPKRNEDFLFFVVNDVEDFKCNLKQLIPCITTTSQIQALRREIEGTKHAGNNKLIKVIGTQISFTSKGLEKLGVENDIGDAPFLAGQLASAQVALEDPGVVDGNGRFVPDWLPAFKGEIHGLISVAGDCKPSVEEGVNKVCHILGKSVREVLRVEGNVRPGKEKGHEHFGFLDGVSLPAIPAITGRKPGQQEVPPGVILCGQPGDTPASPRPAWTKNGSIVVYRHLRQLVPEFNKFLLDNPIILQGLPRDKGSELLGARMVGRWKSGAPIDLTPTTDDPDLAKDPNRNNFFDYGYNDANPDQTRCPFAAHIRKTAPRSFLDPEDAARRQIMRSGIPFGPEVTTEEARTFRTKHARGLSFVCYQSNLLVGFEFMQRRWCNNENFPGVPREPPTAPRVPIGQDPIVGQNRQPVQPGNEGVRTTHGIFPNDQGRALKLPNEFVVSKGGAYLFAPSLSALKTKFVS